MTTNIQSFAGDVQIDSGNLSVKSLEVKDGVTKLGSNNTAYSNVGVMMTRKDGASNVAFLFTEDGANVVLGYTNDDALEGDRIDILTDEKANLVVYGNVYVTGSVHGDGSTLTGLVTTLQSVTEFGAETDQTILFTNEITGINVSSNVLVSGNVTANVYYGDGGLLANITQTLEGITAIGNTTPYTLEFNNTDTSFVTVSNVGIGNALPTADLCVGSNVVIDDERLNKINVVGNVACHQLNLGSVEILPAYSLENVTQISNTTTNTMSFNNSTLAFDTQKMAGIGIIPSSADVGVSGLHVDGHLRLGGEAENTDEEQMYIKAAGALGVLANESDTNNTNTELRLQSGDTNNSNITMVGKSSAQYMTFGTNAAERMRIDSSGNLGIGTTNPEYALHINLDSETGSSNTVALIIQNQSSDYTQIENGFGSRIRFETNRGYDSATQTLPSAEIKGYIYDGAGDTGDYHALDLDVYGDNVSLNRGISILSKSFEGGPADTIMHGNVGIGMTNPTSNLHVAGDAYVSSNLTVGTANLHVDTTTGFVGVGTTKPTSVFNTFGGQLWDGDDHTSKVCATLRVGRGGGDGASRVDYGTGAILEFRHESDYRYVTIESVSDGGQASAQMGLLFKTTPGGGGPVERMRIKNNGDVGIGTSNPEYTLDVAGTSRLGVVALTPQTYLYSNVHNLVYGSGTASDFEQVLLQFDTGGTGSTDQSEYAGYIDVEMVAQRTTSTYYGPEIFTARLNYILGWNEYDNLWRFTTFVQENKSVSAEVAQAFTVFKSVPVFKYKYVDRQLQIYVSFNANYFRGYTSFTARVTSDAPTDVSMPGPDTLMASGTEGTAEVGMCYGVADKAAYVGIGTTNPSHALDVVGDINLTSNIVMSGEVFVKAHDATKNYVAIGPGAGQTEQNTYTVAIGYQAGQIGQNTQALAVGYLAGQTSQGNNATAVGPNAGESNQGTQAVAVGYLAGQTNQHDNTVVLNASGSALNTEGTGRTYIKPLRVATVASNVMTYDQTTGEVMDSGGLFTNRLAVVSQQPPEPLTGLTTTIQGHGKYVIDANLIDTSGGERTQNAFYTGNGWYLSGGYDGNVANTTYSLTGSNGTTYYGAWVSLKLPYKTTLRHILMNKRSDGNTSAIPSFPTAVNVFGSNDDGVTKVFLKNVTGLEPGYDVVAVVDASAQYNKYYLSFPTLYGDNGGLRVGQIRLFTESFSVDGGIMTTTAASGLETGFTEHPVAPMTGFNTYVEGHGTYEASASNFTSGHEPWEAYTNIQGEPRWITNTNRYNSGGTYTGSVVSTDIGGTRYSGEWNQLKFPYAQTISHIDLYATGGVGIERAPTVGVILGSNDGEHWYKLTEFSGKTYIVNIATRIDVNATLSYMYVRLVCTNVGTSPSEGRCELNQINYFSATGVTKMDNVLISGELAVDGGALQTSHIKWPKVPLKANESEGYVASASSTYNTLDQWKAWHAFENKSQYGGNYPAWVSGDNTFINSTGLPDTANCATFDNLSCEWIQIKQPTAIQLSSFKFKSRYLSSTPVSGAMYGSNDDFASYDKLTSFSDNTELEPIINVQSTEKYNAFRLVVTATTTAPTTDIDELQLFESTLGVGTSATTAKLTVDGGLGLAKGSQVFAGSDVVTEFPKHDRPLTKYPEATSGTVVTNSTDTQPGTAFNLNYSDIGWHPTANYTSDTGVADGSTTTIDMKGIEYDGEWTQVLLPVAVKVKYLDVYYRYSSKRQTRDGTVLGSNDGTNWTHLQSWDDLSLTESTSIPHHLEVNSTKYFNYIRYIVERVAGETLPNIREIEIWGTEEGDESVDVVHRSIPNTPGQQQLAVYYEARDPNSYSFADSTKVYDLSGNGVTGTITGNNGFDAEYNAWVFDGSGDYISGTLSNPAGDWTHSLSMWVNLDLNSLTSSFSLFFIGVDDTGYEGVGVDLNSSKVLYYFTTNGNSVIFLDWTSYVRLGEWTHIIFMHTPTTKKIYINGAEVGSVENDVTLALPANTSFYLGNRVSTKSTRGKIANARLYSKALNADQVRELYEYDAPRFGHRQNLVALHKGNLGVGVTNPTSRFEVAGADGLQEFPPKAMTGHETYIEGHGVFRVSASSFLDASEISGWTQDFPTWYAFNKSNTQGWISNQTKYSNSNGIAGTSSDNRFGIRGEWLEIEMPSKIKLKHFTLSLASDGGDYSDAYNTSRFPQVFNLYKSNDGITWTPATEITTPTAPVLASYGSTQQYVIDENEYYNRYLIQVKQTFADGTYTGGQSTHTAIGEWRLFGTPAPSSLEDGHLTLGKALTLPRVSGHPAGAETPRAESLVVHYDTTVDSVVSGSTVVDISGEGNNGTLVNGAAYSSTDRALTFDGGNDYVTGNLTGISGNFIFSASLWVYHTSTTDNQSQFFTIGSNAVNQMIGFRLNGSMTEIRLYFYSRDTLVATISTILNTWNHFVVTYDGSTQSVYQNGVLVKSQAGSGLNLPQNPELRIGYRSGGTSTEYLNGYLSNFKLWNVALMAKEIAQEYALGRTGKSINLTDTALCLGGTVPRAQLDVRGSAYINGIVGTGPTGGLIIPSGTSAQQPTGVTGMLRFNTTLGRLQVHDGTFWKSINRMSASGGTVTYVGGYTVHTFKTGGSFTVASGGDIDVLMVGGGGGGGADNAGGGGAGGLIFRPRLLVDAGSYTIDIGTGGTGAPAQGTTAGKGGDTEAFGLTAVGGGYGNNGNSDGTQNSGGSGGGGDGERGTAGGTGTQPSQSGDSGTYGYGNDGGDGYPSNNNAGGGGGGAGVAGVDGGVNDGGAGGDGLNEVTVNGFVYNFADIFGTASGEIISGEAWFAGGGAGGNKNEVTTSISGGNGGGGGTANYYTDSGTANTGGGGGGSTYTGSITPAGGNGGSGIVIIRYLS
jgi:hypothetical protein